MANSTSRPRLSDQHFERVDILKTKDLAIVAVLSAVAFLVLNIAWMFGNPPGAAPDEDAHFVKAYATAEGQFAGTPLSADRVAGGDTRRAAWALASARLYWMPARVAPPASSSCYAVNPDRTADCLDLGRLPANPDAGVLTPTHLATYNPLPYAILGSVMRGAVDFQSAARRGRLASVVVCTLFLWAALALTSGRGPFGVLSVVLAATPATVFLAGSLNTSGMEITSAICFWAALIVVARRSEQRNTAAWVALAIAGIAFALIRPAGAELIGVVAVTMILLVGYAPYWRIVRQAHVPQAAIATVTLACAASFLWGHFATAHPGVDYALAIHSLSGAVRDLPNQARDVIGIFGWNDTTMPMPAYILGLALVGGLGLLALVVGDRRERIALVGLAGATLGLHLALATLVEAQIGFGMQARYLMPLVVGLLLVAGDIVQLHACELRMDTVRTVLAAGFGGAAVLQLTAFVANEHRYSVGLHGGWLLPWDTRWSPDGGLIVWFAFAAAACGALAASAVVITQRGRLAHS